MIATAFVVFLTLNAMALLFGISLGRSAHREDSQNGWASHPYPALPQPRSAAHDALDLVPR